MTQPFACHRCFHCFCGCVRQTTHVLQGTVSQLFWPTAKFSGLQSILKTRAMLKPSTSRQKSGFFNASGPGGQSAPTTRGISHSVVSQLLPDPRVVTPLCVTRESNPPKTKKRESKCPSCPARRVFGCKFRATRAIGSHLHDVNCCSTNFYNALFPICFDRRFEKFLERRTSPMPQTGPVVTKPYYLCKRPWRNFFGGQFGPTARLISHRIISQLPSRPRFRAPLHGAGRA